MKNKVVSCLTLAEFTPDDPKTFRQAEAKKEKLEVAEAW